MACLGLDMVVERLVWFGGSAWVERMALLLFRGFYRELKVNIAGEYLVKEDRIRAK